MVENRFTGIDGKELSEMTCLSHKSLLNNIIKKRKNDDSIFYVTIPTTPQIRMTRKIVGEYILSETEEHKFFDDSIGMISN